MDMPQPETMAVVADAAASRPYRVAVRELCEFTAKVGDLDVRFTPAPTAQEGIDGHAAVVARRGGDYEKEVVLKSAFSTLRIQGRADGYRPDRNELEEIKTYRGSLDRIPENQRELHWAQLRIYGWILCETRGLPEVLLTLVYYDIVNGDETLVSMQYSADALHAFFIEHCTRFLIWAQKQQAHRIERDRRLAQLEFPLGSFNAGQRRLAEAVYRAAIRHRSLMIEAPTGIGKTIGTLFPALKACAGGEVDKVFFLTAKTSGRQLALDTLTTIAGVSSAFPLRVLELVARSKACVNPDMACNGESCPLARGFYDRLPAARKEAVGLSVLDQAAVRRVALKHEICPYYLSQDLVRWADVVVGDCNYYFDLSGLLFGLTAINGWRVSLLVDEAHNLIDRARSMYSATLEQTQLQAVRRATRGVVKTRLDRLDQRWNELHRDQDTRYAILDELPDRVLGALRETVSSLTEHFTDHPPAAEPELQRFYFDAIQFNRMAEAFGSHSLCDVTMLQPGSPRHPGTSTIGIRNLVPAPFLKPRLAAAQSAVLFSATLSPTDYYQQLIGMSPDTLLLNVPSPFDPAQLSVRVVSSISTRYGDRRRSLAPIARLMANQYARQPGNYLAFFSSFEYLCQAAEALKQRSPEIPAWSQTPGMTEGDRTVFLNRFMADGRGIGFAVLGGAFGEGVDLPGSRLVGTFIATLGLPQLNPFNEEMRRRLEVQFGAGYEYAYLYPGLRKVIQAAGRVIRGHGDRGVVYLIDDRFHSVAHLLPRWWFPHLLLKAG